MVSGNELWPYEITYDMKNLNIGGKESFTFSNMPKSIYSMLVLSSKRYENKTAIIDYNGCQYSYKTLLNMTDSLANILYKKFSIKKGSHVALIKQNNIEFCISFLALLKLGAITIALPSKYKKPEIISLIEKSDAKYIIGDEIYLNWFNDLHNIKVIKSDIFKYLSNRKTNEDNVEHEQNLEDDAIIMFTSGTTSRSKGVLLKNKNIAHAIMSYKRILKITDRDISVLSTPIYHITGMIAILGLFIYAGGTLYIHKKFDPKKVLLCALNNHITFIHASPTVFATLLDFKNDFPKLPFLKTLVCGSSNMPPENIRRIKSWLSNANFHTVYGLTETSSPATIFPTCAADSEYIGSSGIPIPGVNIKIIDKNRNEVEYGKIGEILLQGSVVLEKYYNSKNFSIDNYGWLDTGDLGYINKKGYLYIVDRKKDMINRGGEKICSFDIENELISIDGIIEAAVVAKEDKKYGEIPVAAVRIEEGVNIKKSDIQNILKQKLAKYQIPSQIIFLDKMIKTINGKIDKKAIKKLFI